MFTVLPGSISNQATYPAEPKGMMSSLRNALPGCALMQENGVKRTWQRFTESSRASLCLDQFARTLLDHLVGRDVFSRFLRSRSARQAPRDES